MHKDFLSSTSSWLILISYFINYCDYLYAVVLSSLEYFKIHEHLWLKVKMYSFVLNCALQYKVWWKVDIYPISKQYCLLLSLNINSWNWQFEIFCFICLDMNKMGTYAIFNCDFPSLSTCISLCFGGEKVKRKGVF